MVKKVLILASLSAGYWGLVGDALRDYADGIHSPAVHMWILGIGLYIIGTILLLRLKEKEGK